MQSTLGALGVALLFGACGDGEDSRASGLIVTQGDGGASYGSGVWVGNYPSQGGSQGGWSEQSCAESSVASHLEPVYLIILLDQSGSMGDGVFGSPELKWFPVSEALASFFSEDSSAGFHASLTLFPTEQNPEYSGTASGPDPLCEAKDYSRPTVKMTELPDASPFAPFLATLPNERGTPTLGALAGGIEYAREFLEEDLKVAVVLVTDGQPSGCSADNNVDIIAQTAKEASDFVPTYVIGVGGSLESLNLIAEAGGTKSAITVEVGDPDATRENLTEAMTRLVNDEIPCELALPEAPDGLKLDPQKVNVEFVEDGEITGVNKDPKCKDDYGWHYDSESSPQEIILCEATCDRVKSSSSAAVNVVFGCDSSSLLR